MAGCVGGMYGWGHVWLGLYMPGEGACVTGSGACMAWDMNEKGNMFNYLFIVGVSNNHGMMSVYSLIVKLTMRMYV